MMTAVCYRHFAESPHRNMAIDEWLFARAMAQPAAIALRLYSWQTGAVTFGFNQRIERAVRHDLLGETPLIRRVTGGRALFHDPSEATYAVVVNTDGIESSRLAGSIARTSAVIAEALTVVLNRLGVQSQYLRHTVQADHRPDYFHTAPCFASAARHELMIGNRKVVASAQRRIGSTLLQHGSIKLDGVAYHPALDGPVCPSDRVLTLDPLLAQRFDLLWTTFVEVMAEELDLRCEEAHLQTAEEAEVRRYECEVEKKSILRPDITKHGDVDRSH